MMNTLAFEEMTSGLQFPEGPIAMPDGSVVLVEIGRQRLESGDVWGAAGALGAAVASRFFAVGSIVPWITPGIGVVCTHTFETAHAVVQSMR